jgi:hypothetical protein
VAYSVSLLDDLSCAAVLIVVLAFLTSCHIRCPLIYTAIKGMPLLYLSLQVRSHFLDPYQQHQHGIERFPQIREMMVALESKVQEYGGWGNISCVQVDGKMQMQSSEMCSRQKAPFRVFSVKQRVSGASMRRLCY